LFSPSRVASLGGSTPPAKAGCLQAQAQGKRKREVAGGSGSSNKLVKTAKKHVVRSAAVNWCDRLWGGKYEGGQGDEGTQSRGGKTVSDE
jgi:hypothetical protein